MLYFSSLQESTIRIFFFLLILCIMMLWEWRSPRRKRSFSRTKRWPHNLLIVVLNSFLIRLLFPIVAVGVAIFAETNHWGLFNLLPITYWIKVVISVIMLDLVIYLQHVAFHLIPIFWRIHRMHHTDLDIDTTTGLRFHPIEIILSMIIKIIAVLIIGTPALAVLIFEILLNATSMFNHGNVNLSTKVDCYLRWLIVTPDMHRVHHSIYMKETNSNYGFNLPWWDRLFKTYIPQPKDGHLSMVIGLHQFRDAKYLKLNYLLLIPFLTNNSETTR